MESTTSSDTVNSKAGLGALLGLLEEGVRGASRRRLGLRLERNPEHPKTHVHPEGDPRSARLTFHG